MENNKTTSRFSIRNFELVEPCWFEDTSIKSTESFIVGDTKYEHGLKPQFASGWGKQRINNLQVLIDCDTGEPWQHGCLYLMDKTFYEDADLATVKTIAIDLAQFKSFCDANEINCLAIPRNKRKKPLYRYYQHLKSLHISGEIADSTASRKLRSAVNFYRYLYDDLHIKFENPPFVEKLIFINISTGTKTKFKPVVTTDTAIKVSRPTKKPSDAVYIEDGGQLRPLDYDEQSLLFETLRSIGNTEMTLLFLLATLTGGRQQTCLTMRHKHARIEYNDPSKPVVIAAGMGTLIDTKYNKEIALYLPAELMDKLEVYSRSPRAAVRINKFCLRNGTDPMDDNAVENSYLFLTNQGNPYYSSKADNKRYNPHNSRASFPNGGKVRDFIANQILPAMKKKFGPTYTFRFHDLRATFGMNLVDSLKALVDSRDMTYTDMLEYVRARMSHENSKTTSHYLDYRERSKRLSEIQSTFENKVLGLIELGMGTEQE